MRPAVLCGLCLILVSGQAARGDDPPGFADLVSRLPESANTAILIDVKKTLQSPIAKTQEWAKRREARNSIIPLPAGATAIVMAGHYDFQTMTPIYELGLIDRGGDAFDPRAIARREQGIIDDIAGSTVVDSPRNLYLFALPPRLMGVFKPQDRQALARYLTRSRKPAPKELPDYLKDALRMLGEGNEAVIAFSLVDAVSPRQVRKAFRTEISGGGIRFDQDEAASSLAGARYAILSVRLTDPMQAKLRVEFASPTGYLSNELAKQIVLAALAGAGADIDDVRDWTPRVADKSISLNGPLSREGARKVFSLLEPPSLDNLSAPESALAPPVPGARSSADDRSPPAPNTADASRAYFRSVLEILDDVKAEKRTNRTAVSLWLERYGRKTDDLPILGVDPDLLAFGGTVGKTLREMSSAIKYAGNDARYRMAQNYYVTGYDAKTVDRSETSLLKTFLDTKFRDLSDKAADVRKSMVAKYNVEF